MSQTIFADINPNTESGNQLAQDLNDFKAALMSTCSGISRPSEILAGGVWLDTTSDPSWTLKMYDGVADITLFTIDTTAAVSSVPGATSLFTITKQSADTVAPILEMLKKRVINNGQVLGSDIIGTIQMKGNANDLSVPVTVKIKGVASQNFTATTAGTDIVFEATPAGSVTIAEVMRLKNGLLGVNNASPETTIHSVGTGIKAEYRADNTTPVKIQMRKKKVTGTGATGTGETFNTIEFNSTDDGSGELIGAKIEAIALENHTTTAHGTKLSVSAKAAAATAFTEVVVVATAKTQVKTHFEVANTLATLQTVDSTTTGAAQSITPTTSSYKVTNASLTSINNLASPADGKIVILMNGTGAIVSLVNDSGGTAANRIITGTGADLSLADKASIMLQYDLGATRWRVVGGSGSGSGGGGGGGANWQPTIGLAPTESYEFSEKVWLYQQSGLQSLTLWVKVPNSYTAGQITLKGGFYSPSASNQFKIQAVATLVRTGTDAIDSTSNQTTVNSGDITNTVAKRLRTISFALSDSTGKINSVSSSAGDIIKIELSRIAPSGTEDTDDIRFIPSSTEVLFS